MKDLGIGGDMMCGLGGGAMQRAADTTGTTSNNGNGGDTQGSGGGNIGTGSVPKPGEPGFSANTGKGAA